MDVVARRPAHRPQPLVGLLPVRRDELGKGREQAAVLLVELVAQAAVEQGEVEGLAVDVDLALAVRAVADAHRPAAAMAIEVVEHPLGELVLAPDAVDGLEAGQALADRAGEVVVEAARLGAVAEHREPIEGEAGVAQPAEAVVPVALAAELLRQGGGERRDQRARRRVGHQLERERAAPYRVAIRALVAAIGDPLLPERAGDAEELGDALGRRLARDGAGGEHQVAVAAGVQRDLSARGIAFGRELEIGEQGRHALAVDHALLERELGRVAGEGARWPVAHGQLDRALAGLRSGAPASRAR